jgi:hypothetical protein
MSFSGQRWLTALCVNRPSYVKSFFQAGKSARWLDDTSFHRMLSLSDRDYSQDASLQSKSGLYFAILNSLRSCRTRCRPWQLGSSPPPRPSSPYSFTSIARRLARKAMEALELGDVLSQSILLTRSIAIKLFPRSSSWSLATNLPPPGILTMLSFTKFVSTK